MEEIKNKFKDDFSKSLKFDNIWEIIVKLTKLYFSGSGIC